MDQAVEGERKSNQEAGGEQEKRENFPRWSEKTTVTNLVSALAVVDHQESRVVLRRGVLVVPPLVATELRRVDERRLFNK